MTITNHYPNRHAQAKADFNQLQYLNKRFDVTIACGLDLKPLYCQTFINYIQPLITPRLLSYFFNWKGMPMSLPFRKKADKYMTSKFRPISHLSQIRKVMERLSTNIISITYQKTTFLHPIHGDSTTFQHLHVYHYFLKAVDTKCR